MEIVAVRALAEGLELRGLDLVETVPGGWGTEDVAPLTAAAVVAAALTGVAARRLPTG